MAMSPTDPEMSVKPADFDRSARRPGIVRTAVVLAAIAVAIYVAFIVRAVLSA